MEENGILNIHPRWLKEGYVVHSVRTRFCLIGGVLLATVSACAQGPSPAQKIKPGTLCGPAIVGAHSVLKPRSMVLVGELHGTNEIERSFGDLVCQAALTGTPVWVGLEIPTDEQPAVDAFLASSGLSSDQQKLLEGNFWNGEFRDGRSSQAMLNLLDRFRLFQAAGLKIHTVLFVPTVWTEAKAYEVALAKNVLDVWEKHPHDQFLILVGSAHGRAMNASLQGDSFPSMAGNLRKANSALITLKAAYADGSAWFCEGDSKENLQCGPHQTRGTNTGHTPFLRLHKAPDRDGYTGLFYVGAITASSPGAAKQ